MGFSSFARFLKRFADNLETVDQEEYAQKRNAEYAKYTEMSGYELEIWKRYLPGQYSHKNGLINKYLGQTLPRETQMNIEVISSNGYFDDIEIWTFGLIGAQIEQPMGEFMIVGIIGSRSAENSMFIQPKPRYFQIKAVGKKLELSFSEIERVALRNQIVIKSESKIEPKDLSSKTWALLESIVRRHIQSGRYKNIYYNGVNKEGLGWAPFWRRHCGSRMLVWRFFECFHGPNNDALCPGGGPTLIRTYPKKFICNTCGFNK